MIAGMEARFEVVSPQPRTGVTPQALAPRLASLNDATVGFLWDYLFRGDELFPALEAELGRRFPGIGFVGFDAFGNTHGPDEHEVLAGIPAVLHARHVDAVVSAVGC
jgi:hypothetical protein